MPAQFPITVLASPIALFALGHIGETAMRPGTRCFLRFSRLSIKRKYPAKTGYFLFYESFLGHNVTYNNHDRIEVYKNYALKRLTRVKLPETTN